MDVWIVLATYGPEDDVEPVLVVGYSKEAAEKAMEKTLDVICLEAGGRDFWIVGEAFEQPICGVYQPPSAAWQDPMFSDEDRETMFECCLDEVRDSIKEHAISECETLGMVDCIGFVVDDAESLAEILHWVHTDHISREDLTSEHEDHLEAVRLSEKYGLMDAEGKVSELGEEFIQRWGSAPPEPSQPQPQNGTVH